MQKKLLIIGVVVLIIMLGGWLTSRRQTEKDPNARSGDKSAEQTSEAGFDKNLHSIDEPGSIWWIVNKNRPLPYEYIPPDLVVPDMRLRLSPGDEQTLVRELIANDLKAMSAAAERDGIILVLSSAYRSYTMQKQFYDNYVARDGQAAADRYSARPGTSEHQTGLAVDLTSTGGTCHLEICFRDLPEGQWLANHAHEHGFIIRYPEGKESITSYQYEPWHIRYVGKELASELKRTGQTMEEFFGL